MKVLVLITDYPRPDGTHAYMFAHVRNRYYKEHGIEVTVLNFAAKSAYEIDGIQVIPLSGYKPNEQEYEILISHAPNIRNHYRFHIKYGKKFKRFIFFFHGQEILYLNKSYPKPYPFMGKSHWWYKLFQQMYDFFKIHTWAAFYKRNAYKSDYIFVSQYIFNMFKKNLHLSEKELLEKYHIIHNSIGDVFEHESYEPAGQKKYDFITIRSNWDSSTYCIDLLVKLAEQNPDCVFLLIGKGKYFTYNKVPDNLELITKTISHREMVQYLNNAKCALNLTRQDTQGVMTCELISFGIPVITSDIQVCRDLYSNIPGLRMISNDSLGNIKAISNELRLGAPYSKVDAFFSCNTIQKEVELIKELHRILIEE